MFVDLIRNYTSDDVVRGFVAKNCGLAIPFYWPQGFFLYICEYDRLGYDVDVIIKLEKLLCCPERLICLGFVSDDRNVGKNELDVLVLIGSGGRFYAACARTCAELYRIGDTFDSFIFKGLKRFYPIYHHVPEFAVADADDAMRAVDGVQAVKALRKTHGFRTFRLAWPENEEMVICDTEDDMFCSNAVKTLLSEMEKFGSFGRRGACRSLWVSLYMHVSGRIFSYDDNIGELTYIAECFHHFLKLGVRGHYKDHCLSGDFSGLRRRVPCPNSEAFLRKTAKFDANDTVLFMYRQRRYRLGHVRKESYRL
ncbi:tegument protein [Suid betaherpesvirus 2]|uniref:Tegument protein n=1 Tax=Suid betaherpesvirus 2 TaxID=1608255 RepID=U3GV61_9BETA|nr:tegument protein [Suid betaherpesvirus 2]AGT99203.1 tegument protein [Suid betaherpesvirus 2]